jgi:GH15 family glucan-1,4-alpha-glucosidase
MTYAPTGAPVAAPTTGLPEQEGGERNWDYRYTWIRDGSFSIYALLSLGYVEEAAAFGAWLRDRTQEQAGQGSGPLKIMYRVDGTSDLVEEILDHFEGWRGSRPVRIGNGAADSSSWTSTARRPTPSTSRTPTASRWPTRAGRRYRASSTGCASTGTSPTRASGRPAAAGRTSPTAGSRPGWRLIASIRMAQPARPPADIARWTADADAVYRQVMERGWNPEGRGVHPALRHLRCSTPRLLKMPLQGFIAPRDPLWLSTLAAMDRELVSDSLVYRYNPAASPDGLAGDEGTFSLCTFWYVDALARAGRLDDARLTFEKMHTYANHLGLYSEEIGSTGEQLGNFPQAFSHLALISAASTSTASSDQRRG